MELSQKTTQAIRRSQELTNWIDGRMEIGIDQEKRGRLSATCLDMVHEHQKSIGILLEHNCYGSAFALLRPAYEAYLRGEWIWLCATEKQMQELLEKDRIQPHVRDMVSDIREQDSSVGRVVEKIRGDYMSTFSSFVHTGSWQILARNTEQTIEPNYENQNIQSLIFLADIFALLAGLRMARLSGSQRLIREFEGKLSGYLDVPRFD